MASSGRFVVGILKNVVTGKNIELCVKTYGDGYIRPDGAMKEITANARREILARAKGAVEEKQNLFSQDIMKQTNSLFITNPTEHSSDHKDSHWDIDACTDANGQIKIKNAHFTKDSGAQTMRT